MNNEEFAPSGDPRNASPTQANAGQAPRQLPIHLTPRESEIARYVMLGESNKQIARRLGISNYTVRDHVSNLLKKSGVTSRTRLALVLPASSIQPPTVAPRPDPIRPISPISVTHRANGHSLPATALDGHPTGLPWRK